MPASRPSSTRCFAYGRRQSSESGKKLLVTIDQAHRLHKLTAKPAGRVTAGAASTSDKRVNAAIAATKALTLEEITVFAEWLSDYCNDLIDEGAPSPGGGTGVRQTKIVDSR